MTELLSEQVLDSFFGAHLPLAHNYYDFLRTEGITRGFVGANEYDKLWSRHILNSALLAPLLNNNSVILDIGSGAGLPGLPLYLSNPTLRIYLLDALEKRVKFLDEFVETHSLQSHIFPLHGRAEDPRIIKKIGTVDYIVARAVTSIGKLTQLALPYFKNTTQLLAIKGRTIHAEIEKDHKLLKKLPVSFTVEEVHNSFYDDYITIVRVQKKAIS